jgi:pentatricopeptide repeat protein
LFNACAQLKTTEALNVTKKISKQMPKSFHSNPYVLTSLLDAFMKCGDVADAQSVFNKLTKKDLPMYGTMMSGFNKENYPSETLDLFNQMKLDQMKANIVIYLCVIKALSQIGDYSISQSIVRQIPDSFLDDNRIQNTLIDMWVR